MKALVFNQRDVQVVPDDAPVPDAAIVAPLHASALGSNVLVLVYDGSVVRDAFSLTKWYISEDGTKNAALLDQSWQEVVCSFSDRLVKIEGVWSKPPEDERLKADLIAYAATRRKQIEEGGTISATYGPLFTDRETRGIIGNVIQSLERGYITSPIRFKTPSGYSSITTEVLDDIAREVALHVQRAFDNEDIAAISINDGTITTREQVDAIIA